MSSGTNNNQGKHTNCTHLLNVKMYQPCSSEIKKQIQQEVYRKINNVPIEYMYDGMNIIITWHCNDTQTNQKYYYTDVLGMLGDNAVHLHTEMLLEGMLPQLNEKFNNIFEKGDAQIGFTITKPISYSYALSNIDITGVV